jgi:hypothetical protein
MAVLRPAWSYRYWLRDLYLVFAYGAGWRNCFLTCFNRRIPFLSLAPIVVV